MSPDQRTSGEAARSAGWPVEGDGVLMAQGKVLRAPDLGLNAGQATPRMEDMSLEEVESFLIKKTLALALGLSIENIQYRI